MTTTTTTTTTSRKLARLGLPRSALSLAALLTALTIGPLSNRKLHSALAQDTDEQLRPSLLVDTKYWIRSTQFGVRDNWLNRWKPCTLMERILINEPAVVSLGDALDSLSGSLESNLHQLGLAPNGHLLLEGDDLADSLDPLFVQYLNQSGDCFEQPSRSADQRSEDKEEEESEHSKEPVFVFEPHPDDLSWFNPSNWASSLLDGEMAPDSHRVPCAEDVVVFGSRQSSPWQALVDASERSQVLSFKVHFRPSDAYNGSQPWNGTLEGVRVARLRIGEQGFNQDQFDQLAKGYDNLLFEFRHPRSLLSQPAEDQAQWLPLIIDESQLLANEEHSMCLDEAGCQCGNERPEVMKAICSFNEPLSAEQLPCRDPIRSSGYCNRICGTSISIQMDPSRFSERFIITELSQILQTESILVASRRVDQQRYEILFRPVLSGHHKYEDLLGKERQFAQLLVNRLERAAIKSFYGIKSVSIRSSSDWRRSDRLEILCGSLLVLVPLAILAAFVLEDGVATGPEYRDAITRWLYSRWLVSGPPYVSTEGPILEPSLLDSSSATGSVQSLAEIALVELMTGDESAETKLLGEEHRREEEEEEEEEEGEVEVNRLTAR